MNIAKLPSVPRQILKDIPRPPSTASPIERASFNVRAYGNERGSAVDRVAKPQAVLSEPELLGDVQCRLQRWLLHQRGWRRAA